MEYLISIVIGVVCSVIAAEVYAYAPLIAEYLLRRAATKIPEDQRDRYLAEWRAHAADLPGSLAKLYHGLGCLFGARAVARELRKSTFDEKHRWLFELVAKYTLRIVTFRAALPYLLRGQFLIVRLLWALICDPLARMIVDHAIRDKTDELDAAVGKRLRQLKKMGEFAEKHPELFVARWKELSEQRKTTGKPLDQN